VQRINLLAIALWTCLPAARAVCAADASIVGTYSGQGRGCWGALHITARTIEWNTQYSICKPTAYEVLAQTHGAAPRTVFRLEQKSRRCRYAIIELGFDPKYPDYWRAVGYSTREDFDLRAHPTDASRSRTLDCSVRKRSG
jgi:hypothetical protein